MSAASLSHRQIARIKNEAEVSLASARSLRDQWLVATSQNPNGLTQKDIDQLGKAFQNRLLTVKWDCEDLEELVSGECGGGGGGASGGNKRNNSDPELASARIFIAECRNEIASCTRQLEHYEASRKLFHKHGIETTSEQATNGAQGERQCTLPNNMVAQAAAPTLASIIQNPLHMGAHYQRLNNEQTLEAEGAGAEFTHFDKRQLDQTSTTIFNNALYEHFEDEDALTKSINATKVFNSLTRPRAEDICVGTNENEMILEMLETEYYNAPGGPLAKAKYAGALRNFFDVERNRFLSTIALLFSFPILLILFLVI